MDDTEACEAANALIKHYGLARAMDHAHARKAFWQRVIAALHAIARHGAQSYVVLSVLWHALHTLGLI